MTKPKDAAKPEAAPAVHVEKKAKFVTVASKLPMSIVIQLDAPRTARVTGQFGSVEETVFVPTGESYVINGTAYPTGQPPKGFPRRAGMIEDDSGGYALTPNVPAEFFAEWLKQKAGTEIVRNGLIKANADLDDLAADAAEHAKQDSGLGPMNPDGDRRSPKPANASVAPIKPEPRAAAA